MTSGQWKLLKSKDTAKEFVYSVMGMIWTRDVLFTHSVTGRASNAHGDKEAKPALDQEKVKSICGKLSVHVNYGCLELK